MGKTKNEVWPKDEIIEERGSNLTITNTLVTFSHLSKLLLIDRVACVRTSWLKHYHYHQKGKRINPNFVLLLKDLYTNHTWFLRKTQLWIWIIRQNLMALKWIAAFLFHIWITRIYNTLILPHFAAMLVMTQVPAANAQNVCEKEIQGLPCNSENLPFCISQCETAFGQSLITTECVEINPDETICVCFFKSANPCPPPKIH